MFLNKIFGYSAGSKKIMSIIGEQGREGAIEYGTSHFKGNELLEYYNKLGEFFNYTIPKGNHKSNLLKRISECQNCAKA